MSNDISVLKLLFSYFEIIYINSSYKAPTIITSPETTVLVLVTAFIASPTLVLLLVAVKGGDAVDVVKALVAKTSVTLTSPFLACSVFPADFIVNTFVLPTLTFPSMMANSVITAI